VIGLVILERIALSSAKEETGQREWEGFHRYDILERIGKT
jgi:hypothetical protein